MTVHRLEVFRRWLRASPEPRDAAWVALAGLFVRLAVVWWAAARFPPAEDGRYYDVVANRIARGLGYTWLWADGVVTYAAHYPVGYPALVGGLYAILSPSPVWAMAFNGILGAVAVVAVHRVASTEANRGGALAAACSIAFHPGLFFYTPALMTEGVAAGLLAIGAWIAVCEFGGGARGGALRAGALGGVFALVTLVRPQAILLAPLYAFCWPRSVAWKRVIAGLATLAVAAALCVPWTARNCVRMKSCVFVSANSGWNLFIGSAEGATGSWVPLERLGVPAACGEVWGEAEKDACFRAAAIDRILNAPGRFLALVPAKLAATFDYAGAAGWYLNSSNPKEFGEREKFALGVAETVWQRALVLASLCALGSSGPRRRTRIGIVIGSISSLFTRAGWIAHVGLAAAALLFGRRLADKPAAFLAAATVAITALTHAAFFGAGRYSLVCFPAIAALAGTVLTRRDAPRDTGLSKE